MSNNKWLESLSDDARTLYLEKLNAKKRERYAASAEYRDYFRTPDRYKAKREAVIAYLGGRCVHLACSWLNEDGTRGCTDHRCLQIDHVNGDGAKLRKIKGQEGSRLLDTVLKTVPGETYQLLCANCNWIKRYENRECPQPRHTDDSYVFADNRKLRQKDELGRFVSVGGV